MNGAESIINRLEQHGVDTVFGYPGGCIMPLYDALVLRQQTAPAHILCRHEQACALAANGYARASGRLGVCIATSGPGACNLITGVADAYADSVPLLVITGQVPLSLLGTDAFQETDMLGMTLGIVKHSYLVTSAEDLPAILDEAITLAQQGRPGPVWIDIPKDVLLAPVMARPDVRANRYSAPLPCDNNISMARLLLLRAKRPLIYAGGGILLANAVSEFRDFLSTTGIPCVETLKALGCCGRLYAANLGMLGMHGSRAANLAVAHCDVLLCIGARFDDRATGRLDTFAPHAQIIQLDCDQAEIGKLRQPDLALTGHLPAILPRLEAELSINDWQQQCLAWKADCGFADVQAGNLTISGPDFIRQLSAQADQRTIISCDVGQHQMWVAQYYDFAHPRLHLTSGGLGTMGFGLPAAIGACFARPDHRVVLVSGDGSFMMNVQELATVSRYRLPVKMIVLDNQCLGMVRQQQELFYQQRYSEIDLSDNPDFSRLAEVFSIPAITVTDNACIAAAIKRLMECDGPLLLHVAINPADNVWPVVAAGKANTDMLDRTTMGEIR